MDPCSKVTLSGFEPQLDFLGASRPLHDYLNLRCLSFLFCKMEQLQDFISLCNLGFKCSHVHEMLGTVPGTWEALSKCQVPLLTSV